MTLIEALSDAEIILERDLGAYSIAAKMHKSHENEGVILFFRTQQGDYGTIEWAAKGRPLALHTGHYDIDDYDEAMFDFEARGR